MQYPVWAESAISGKKIMEIHNKINQYFEELWWEHQKSKSLSILGSSHTDHVEIIQDNCDIGFHVLSNIPNYLFYALEFAKNVPAATNLWHPDVGNFLWKSEIRNSILESNIVLECLLASPPTFTFCLIVSKKCSALEEDQCSVRTFTFCPIVSKQCSSLEEDQCLVGKENKQ